MVDGVPASDVTVVDGVRAVDGVPAGDDVTVVDCLSVVDGVPAGDGVDNDFELPEEDSSRAQNNTWR